MWQHYYKMGHSISQLFIKTKEKDGSLNNIYYIILKQKSIQQLISIRSRNPIYGNIHLKREKRWSRPIAFCWFTFLSLIPTLLLSLRSLSDSLQLCNMHHGLLSLSLSLSSENLKLRTVKLSRKKKSILKFNIITYFFINIP